MRQAAEYCGYGYETFRKMMRSYQLPKYGPKRNRFSVVDLDAFMANPEEFRQVKRQKVRRAPLQLAWD
jgi:hypothetical protein